jgi:MFS family permease
MDTASSSTTSPGFARLALWRLTAYRWFLVSLGAATLASQVQGAAVAYQLYALTHDPLSLGMIGLAEALPFILSALPAGHLADVHDRRRLGGAALVVLVLAAGALWLVSTFQGALGGRAVRATIYGVIALTGVCRSFLQPARSVLTSELVPRELLPAAVSWRSGLWQLAAVTGPALGGVLYAGFGPRVAYAVSAALLAGAVLAWVRMAAQGAAVPVPPRRAAMLTSLREGFRFLRHEPVILPAIALDLFAVLFGGAVALLPVFAEDILRVGPRGYGVLRAAPAVGALTMSLIMVLRPPFRRAGVAMLNAVALFGVFTIAFGISRSFVLSVALLAASGAVDMISVVIRGTLMQVRVPPSMLGRLSAINQIFIGSSNEIGAFESGVLARLLGTVPSVVFGGGMTLLVVAVASWRAPALRKLPADAGGALPPA